MPVRRVCPAVTAGVTAAHSGPPWGPTPLTAAFRALVFHP